MNNVIVERMFHCVLDDWDCVQLPTQLQELRKRKGTLAVANGCFDMFHPGHVATLRYVHQVPWIRGPVTLIVLVNSDESVKRLKGPDRPYQGFRHRASVVSAVKGVSLVVGFKEDTPEELISVVIKPQILIKGAEYSEAVVPGEQYVRSEGGTVLHTPMVQDYSTTGFAKKFQESLPKPMLVIHEPDGSRVESKLGDFLRWCACRRVSLVDQRNIVTRLVQDRRFTLAEGYHVVVLTGSGFVEAAADYLARD